MAEFLFKRRCKLILAFPIAADFSSISAQVIEIENLRMSFKITQTQGKQPNSAEIKVYNLSDQTRGALPGKGAKVVLQAGYDQTLEQIFLGDARLIESKRDNLEWVTTIQSGDGERAFLHGRVNTSFGIGTRVADVINTIGKATGLPTGNLAQVARGDTSQFAQGYVAHGKAIPELAKVLKMIGYELSIQDGVLQALKPGETTTEIAVELSPETGLIGSPQTGSQGATGKKKGKPTLEVKSLLQPVLRPGRKVRLISRQYDGLYKAIKVEHVGDTAGGDWFSNVELEAL